MEEKKRETWGSKLAFILAAIGSAVGLGNIWRFPVMTGNNGGAVFVFLYLITVAFIGIPLMLAEFIMGRYSRKSVVGAFSIYNPKSPWRLAGYLGVITGFGILSYYSVVAGWTIGYLYKTAIGEFSKGVNPEYTKLIFQSFVSSPFASILCDGIMIFLTIVVVIGGIKEGIERWCKILMPLLYLLLIVIDIRALTLPGASEGVKFFLYPDLSKLTLTSVIAALGQAFFSLSLGMGVMVTYGSYLSKKEDLLNSSIWISGATALVAILAGLGIFPALFSLEGVTPEEGAGLIFKVLPNIFDKIPLGRLFGVTFFLLLIIAALTSTVSLLEVISAYFIDEKGWSRFKATLFTGAITFILSIPSALSFGGAKIFTHLYKGEGVLVILDLIFGNFTLIIGGLLISLFVTLNLKQEIAKKELNLPEKLFKIWYLLISLVVPLGIFLILVFKIYQLISS